MTFGILRTDGILRTGELPHHILHFADRDALGGAPNRSAKLDVLWTVSGKTALAAHVVGDKKNWRNTCREFFKGGGHVVRFQSVHVGFLKNSEVLVSHLNRYF